MKFKISLFLAMPFICLSSCKSKEIPPADTTVKQFNIAATGKMPENEFNRLKDSCEQWYKLNLQNDHFNGSMIVAQHGQIIFERYQGMAHLNGKDSINANTSFHIASTSKTFTAMTVLKLWQEGKFQLDDEFSKYFPSVNYPGVSIRSLLNHRSGLPNYVYFVDELKWNSNKYVSNQDVLDLLIRNKSKLKGTGKANTRFNYCNTNYVLLALLIEKITGTTYPEYLKKEIFDPLHMDHTFVWTDAHMQDMNPSYDRDGREAAFTNLDKTYGDKNIYSTPQDLLKWDRLLHTEQFVSKKTMEEAYKPYSKENVGIRNYGLGWRMCNYHDGYKIVYHNGWWHGSNSAFIRLINEDAVIFVIGNRYCSKIYKSKALINAFNRHVDTEQPEE
jgi:CubicO group peptidase (beta-lactamase class C family)